MDIIYGVYNYICSVMELSVSKEEEWFAECIEPGDEQFGEACRYIDLLERGQGLPSQPCTRELFADVDVIHKH